MQRLAFGARVTGQTFGTTTTTPPKINLLRIEEELSTAHLRLSRVMIERLDWRKCVERYDRPHTLFYMDPPYWETQGYGVPFPLAEYSAIAESMRRMSGKAVVSINDVPAMRSAFAGFRRKRVSIDYTVGKTGKARDARGEMIVMNW